MKKRKGYAARPLVSISRHALDRLREHWPSMNYMYDSELRFVLSDQILDAVSRDDYVVAPGGTYVPISIVGNEGYAVMVDSIVRTVLPTAWCKEVETIRSRRN